MAALALLIAAAMVSSACAARDNGQSELALESEACAAESKDPCDTKPAGCEVSTKPLFFDMKHSNNAARIRLYIRLYVNVDNEEKIPTCFVTYADMRCPWFLEINPNQKVPALIVPGNPKETIYESNVIYEYVIDSFPVQSPDPLFQHRDLSAMARAKVNLMCRVHDMYVASPNCNQPGCTHSQGALYLPPPGLDDPTDGRRAIDTKTRARKIKELWDRWTWLEDFSKGLAGNKKYLAGDYLSMADTTWFPTAVFMEFLLKHVADWPTLFADADSNGENTKDLIWNPGPVASEMKPQAEIWNPGPVASEMKARFPKLTAWYHELLQNEKFRTVREEIMGFWLKEKHLDAETSPEDPPRKKRFDPIIKDISDNCGYKWKPEANSDGKSEWPSSS